MKSVKLKTYPKSLPDDVEVRDFDLGGGKFARVIMEAKREVHHGEEHFIIQAQAYQMDKNGQMVQAPLGYPSRSNSTRHSVQASDMGATISMGNSWAEVAKKFDPEDPGDIRTVKKVPTQPGETFGEMVWVTDEQKVYRWAEGFADTIARTKVEDLQKVLKTSDIRSGFAFRNRTTKE